MHLSKLYLTVCKLYLNKPDLLRSSTYNKKYLVGGPLSWAGPADQETATEAQEYRVTQMHGDGVWTAGDHHTG